MTRESGGAHRPPLRIAVVGSGGASDEEARTARALGLALGRAGAVVVCGGRGGVMEEAARGCAEAGGWTVGLLPGSDPDAANPWIRLPLATGLGEARNALVVRAGEAVLAVGGSWGTLSEIALARKMGRPVGLLGRPPAEALGLTSFRDPEAAAEWALERAGVERRRARGRNGSMRPRDGAESP